MLQPLAPTRCPIPGREEMSKMTGMFLRPIFRTLAFVAGFALAATSLCAQQDDSHRGRKYKVPPPSSRIEVTVLRDLNGKPIEAAAVIFHPMEGERDKGAMELKTNEDGKAVIDVIPIGDVVRLQVIAKGFQTYGGDYKIDKPQMAMEIRLKRPGGQYSIYKEHPDSANSDDGGSNAGQSQKPPESGSQTAPKGNSKSKDQSNQQSNPDQAQPKSN